jgi:hypothetical protein
MSQERPARDGLTLRGINHWRDTAHRATGRA